MESYWALKQSKKKRDQPTPPPRGLDSDDEDSDSEGSVSESVASVVSSLHSVRLHVECGEGELLLVGSSLEGLPVEALCGCFYYLTGKDLMRCLVTCPGWRHTLLQETPLNEAFWRDEVRRCLRSARIWSLHHKLYKSYFRRDLVLPDVADSFALCKIRLKKLHDIEKRKEFYSTLTPADERVHLIQKESINGEPTLNHTPPHLYFVTYLVKISRPWKGMGIPLLLFMYIQGAVITVALSFGEPTVWGPLFIPTYIVSVVLVSASLIDVGILISSNFFKSAAKYEMVLPMSRWVTISEHPTVNRVTLTVAAVCWSVFGIMLEVKIDKGLTNPGWVVAFSPMLVALGLVVLVLAVDLYRQRLIYFWLDDGYDFVESDKLEEAEAQLDETWRHLISPKLYIALSFLIFLVLLTLRIDGVLHTPYTVIFIPIYILLLVLRRLSSHPKTRPYRVWSFITLSAYFLLLSFDLDLTEYLDGKIGNLDNLEIPFTIVCIPFWFNLLSPLLVWAGVL